MAQEQLLRLRYKGEIVGYGKIDKPFEECKSLCWMFSKDMKEWRTMGEAEDEGEIPMVDSFDPSLKQGDEVFFEGDEVGLKQFVNNEVIKGKLSWSGYRWGIIVKEVGIRYVFENDTLTLIRRAE